MPKPRLYSAMKKMLRAQGIGPLFSARAKKRGKMRRPSIPQMYPNIKGANASRYQRAGKPQINKIYGPAKTILEKVPIGRNLYERGDFGYNPVPESRIVPKVVPGDVVGLSETHRIKRLARRSGAGKGSSGGERGSRVTGSAASRRVAARFGGTRGARPQREKRKSKKQ